MQITVVGSGYVGLVSGVCLAAKGHDVVCVDVRADVVEQLNRGRAHIHEAGLPSLLRDVLAQRRFRAQASLDDVVEKSDLVLIAVGTPSANGKIDLRAVENAATEVGSRLRAERYCAVVVKSTVVPGTTDTVVREWIEHAAGLQVGQFGLGMNPEFLREGNAIEDFMNPDRIVLGHEDAATLRRLQEAYAPWDCDKLAVNTRTAEMIKYANNCLLATQISAVNELANLCFALGGIDAQQVLAGVHFDRRWNPVVGGERARPDILTYLVPGCGFGGSCFPKDVQALRTLGREHGQPMCLLQAVLDINERQPGQVVALLQAHAAPLEGRKVLVLGLAFKPETDDVRESASLSIIRHLIRAGCEVATHDPAAAANARRELYPLPVTFLGEWEPALPRFDVIIVATKWREYARLAHTDLASQIRGKWIVDPRRMLRADDFAQGTYLTIGHRAQRRSP